MSDVSEPMVRLLRAHCEDCGLEAHHGWLDGDRHEYPLLISRDELRNAVQDAPCPMCGGQPAVVMEPA